jgi:hypothetical protein
MALQNQHRLTNLLQHLFPPPTKELLKHLPTHLKNSYAHDFYLADQAFQAGQLETTTRSHKKYLECWQAYMVPLGVDSYLQDTSFSMQMQTLSGFMAHVRTGYYGKGKQVKNSTVCSVLTSVGQTIVLACNDNPTKVNGSNKIQLQLQIMLDGYGKEDLATIKKLQVQSDVPELLVTRAYDCGGMVKDKLSLISP